jgi:hypothetical protein
MIPFERDSGRDGPSGPGRGSEDDLLGGAGGPWGGRLRGFAGGERPPRVREFPARGERAGRRRRSRQRGGWLIAPLMLAAVAAGLLFVLRGPDQVFGVAFAAVLVLGIGWILVSALLPGRAERTCPACGGAGLERLDPQTTQGLRCGLCGWRDESASSFLLAEEEGPLEDIVLRQRRAGRRRW